MKLTSSIVAIAALSTMSFAGGDIIEPIFEQEIVDIPVEPPVKIPAPVIKKEPVVVVPPKVVAEPLGFYIAGGLTDVAVHSRDTANLFSDEVGQDRQIGLTGRIGYDFMEFLGAELRGTYGIAKDDGSKFKQAGVYAKPNYDIADTGINLYGLLGASQANMNPTGNETAFSYGAGLDYGVANNVSVFTDVVNYLKKSDTNSQWGLTLGAAYQF